MQVEHLLNKTRQFLAVLKHCQKLNMQVEAADEHGLTLRLPYAEHLIGDPDTGVIHGGAITTLLDTTCGISTLCALPEPEICPTLDLRIDYMHPAEPGKDVLGFAHCYRVTPHVIFTRGYAYHDDPQSPIAHVVGTFMRMGSVANRVTDKGIV